MFELIEGVFSLIFKLIIVVVSVLGTIAALFIVGGILCLIGSLFIGTPSTFSVVGVCITIFIGLCVLGLFFWAITVVKNLF